MGGCAFDHIRQRSAMSGMSGFIIKASCDGHSSTQSIGLREGYQELVADLAEAFDLIPASVTLFSMHSGTKLMVHLGSQGDLDVVLAETMEWGSHMITVEVTGIPARRLLDGFGSLAAAAATISQLGYLYWIVVLDRDAPFYRELTLWFIMIFAVLANLGNFFYLLDDETDKNHPFRLWARPFSRRLIMLCLAPFTGDVLPLVGCKACGLDAPIRASTRDGVVKWGVLMMALQDGMVLWLLKAIHTGDEALPLSAWALACISLTGFSVMLNLPRRVSHFVLASCEAAHREKEELADDAKMMVYVAKKIAKQGERPTFKDPNPSRPSASPPPARPVASSRTTPPPANAAPSKGGVKAKMKAKGQQRALY